MVPSVFVVLDGLPLTANGKVDHTVLPPPALENTLRDEPAAMSSETEATLASIASELLRVPEVGLEDDFFLLGGHSLLGTQLIVRIRESFGVEIPLRTMFEQPTVRGLAAEIEQLLIAKAEEISEDKVQITLERRSGNDCRDVHSTSNKNSGEFNPYVILDRTFAD
jgi:acyl carrier protein